MTIVSPVGGKRRRVNQFEGSTKGRLCDQRTFFELHVVPMVSGQFHESMIGFSNFLTIPSRRLERVETVFGFGRLVLFWLQHVGADGASGIDGLGVIDRGWHGGNRLWEWKWQRDKVVVSDVGMDR